MDLEKTVKNALEDGTEYYVTDGNYELGGSRVVGIAPKPEHQSTGGIVTDTVRDLLKSSDPAFLVRIYEGDDLQAESEVQDVAEAEEWLSTSL